MEANVIAFLALIGTTWFIIYQVQRDSTQWKVALEHRLTSLEGQVAPLYAIVEDSVLKSVTHNPLSAQEIAALNRYHARREDVDIEDLLIGKRGLQRELKVLEDLLERQKEQGRVDPALAGATVPYVLTIAAIDRRLALKGYTENDMG
jgi:hypothetical protein